MKKFIAVLIVISMTFIFVTIALADLNDGLVAYYPFNGDANDTSGHGNDGTVYGATLTTDRFGNSDSAYSFDGVDDYIHVLHSPNLNINLTGFTAASWFKANPIQTYRFSYDLIDKSHGHIDFTGWTIQGHPTVPSIEFGIGNGTGSWQSINHLQRVEDNQWHHFAAIYTGQEMKFYLDGFLRNTITFSGVPAPNSRDLFIGKHWALGRYYHGILDDIRIYNRAISESEIQELYNETPPSLEKPEPTVEMVIDKLEVNLKDGKFEIKGYLDTTDPDFGSLVLDPQSRLLLELQTGGTEDDPEFGIVGEDQIQLMTDDDGEELKFEAE